MKAPIPDLKKYGLIWEYWCSAKPKYFIVRPIVRLYRFYTRKNDVFVVMLDNGIYEWFMGAGENPVFAFEMAIAEWDEHAPEGSENPIKVAYEVFREALSENGDDA